MGYLGGKVWLWDLGTGRHVAMPPAHTRSVDRAAWSPDGTRLATSGLDQRVVLWDPGNRRTTATLHPERASMYARLSWSPDSTRLATFSGREVALWDPAGPSTSTRSGHSGSIRVLAFSPDGSRLATIGYDENVRLWNPATGLNTATVPAARSPLTAVAWSPDGTLLATQVTDAKVGLCDRGGRRIATLTQPDLVSALAWSPDGTRLAVASSKYRGFERGSGYVVRIWERTTLLAPLQRWTRGRFGSAAVELIGHARVVTTLAWSPDSRCLATGDDSGDAVRLWHPTTGLVTAKLPGHLSRADTVAWSPDGSRLAAAGQDRRVRLWDPATGLATATLPGEIGGPAMIRWSPDGTLLAMTNSEGKVVLSDVAAGGTSAVLTGHGTRLSALVWSPDGSRLATADHDGTVTVWDSEGRECASLTLQPVLCLAWSGSKLAVGQWRAPVFVSLRDPPDQR